MSSIPEVRIDNLLIDIYGCFDFEGPVTIRDVEARQKIAAGLQAAIADEREAVVKWLRTHLGTVQQISIVNQLADCIESGDHVLLTLGGAD